LKTEFMATKKVSAKTVVAEKPAKATKPATTTTPVAEKKAAPAAKKATPAPKKAVVAEKPAVKVAAPAAKKAAKVVVATSKVTFVLPKEAVENAETVAVLGDFNNWQDGVTLKKQKDGSFATAIELEKGRSYEFRFLINGEKWENAWNAEAYKPTPFGAYNSVVTA
jgi:Glycogen recognition site of AMP-activated protein kinase